MFRSVMVKESCLYPKLYYSPCSHSVRQENMPLCFSSLLGTPNMNIIYVCQKINKERTHVAHCHSGVFVVFRCSTLIALLTSTLVTLSVQANQLSPIKFCVWDPVGSTGPFIAFLKQTKLEAISWGIDLQLDAYTDEKVAANDFKSGVCDAVFLTNLLAKDFVPFSAAFGAPGGIRSLDGLKTLSATLNNPKATKLVRHDKYEVTGLFPIGEIYPFLRNRDHVAISSISGKKVAILNGDAASTKFVETVGASPVHTSLATWAGQFNNGNLDVMFGPALAYNTFELYKGLGENGGIVKYNILYAVMEMVVNVQRVPEQFPTLMRKHALTRFNELENTVAQAESEIPAKYWIDLEGDHVEEYESMVKQVRLSLRDENVYDPKAITLLWKIRCKFDPTATECATPE